MLEREGWGRGGGCRQLLALRAEWRINTRRHHRRFALTLREILSEIPNIASSRLRMIMRDRDRDRDRDNTVTSETESHIMFQACVGHCTACFAQYGHGFLEARGYFEQTIVHSAVCLAMESDCIYTCHSGCMCTC